MTDENCFGHVLLGGISCPILATKIVNKSRFPSFLVSSHDTSLPPLSPVCGRAVHDEEPGLLAAPEQASGKALACYQTV